MVVTSAGRVICNKVDCFSFQKCYNSVYEIFGVLVA